MGELGSAGEWAQQWAESLGVPVSMTNSLGMCFVLIPPGGDKENPSSTHVGAPYYYGVHELTTAQFQQFMVAVGYRVGNGSAAGPLSPGGLAQSDRHPVVGLTAADAEAFCHWLSQHEGASYRLPTQAEWAHACRAGAAARVWFGDEKAEWGRYAWYESNSGGRTHQVGLLEANPFGLHDLVGNAAEWCVSGDWRSGRPPIASHYVLCGGCWSSPAAALNAVVSNQNPAVTTTGGLRLVLELPLEARWPRRSAASRRRSTR
jgi:formylglycine-generating enzyme required for sulfatase activity